MRQEQGESATLVPKDMSFQALPAAICGVGELVGHSSPPAHSEHLPSTNCMPSTILDAEDARGEGKGSCSHGMPFLVGETDNKQATRKGK